MYKVADMFEVDWSEGQLRQVVVLLQSTLANHSRPSPNRSEHACMHDSLLLGMHLYLLLLRAITVMFHPLASDHSKHILIYTPSCHIIPWTPTD